MLIAKRVVTHHFATLGLVFFYLIEANYSWAKAALNAETVDYFFNYSTRPANFNVFVADWAVFIKDQPVFDAELAEEFIAIIALFGFAAHL